MKSSGLFLLIFFWFGMSTLYAEGVGANIFSTGHTRLSLSGGYGVWNNRDYGIAGLGAGYYLMDGLEAGVVGKLGSGTPHTYIPSAPKYATRFINWIRTNLISEGSTSDLSMTIFHL
jgi:hypothetical protein